MKKTSYALLVLTLLLSACSTSKTATETAAVQPVANPSAADSTSVPEAAVSAREAVLSEIENTVSVRKTSADALVSAEQGMSILEGGSVETGEDSRVRLDLMPEGTIVRVGPNSAFNFSKLADESGQPKTTIQLLFGKVFVLLNGGSLNVETPSGVASVRGSLLSVQYDPESGRITASCLEGDCGISGENGEEVDIPEGASSFVEEGQDPNDPYPMDRDDVEDWLNENPEIEDYMSELPDPEDFPDLPPDFDGNLDEIPDEYLTDFYSDGTPPPTEESVTEVPSTDEPVATDAPATDAPAATDAP